MSNIDRDYIEVIIHWIHFAINKYYIINIGIVKITSYCYTNRFHSRSWLDFINKWSVHRLEGMPGFLFL